MGWVVCWSELILKRIVIRSKKMKNFKINKFFNFLEKKYFIFVVVAPKKIINSFKQMN